MPTDAYDSTVFTVIITTPPFTPLIKPFASTDAIVGSLEVNVTPLFCASLGATQKRLNWSSSDPSIVIVDGYGNIHGVNLGTAIITA